MNTITKYLSELVQGTRRGWNQFWFTSMDVATLSLIRVLAGAMLVYTHLVWSRQLWAFLSPNGLLERSYVHKLRELPSGMPSFAWTYWDWLDRPAAIWTVHILGLVVLVMFTLGLFTRVTSILAFLITISYVHRLPGALFGLDQINGMLALYLMLGPAGAAFSLDRRRAAARGTHVPTHSVAANIAIRLIQVHMCVIYFFAGAGKLLGASWWDGTAMWGAVANFEYQSVDITWLAHAPWVINGLTHLTVTWELTYPILVWPRLTRPIVLLLAVPLHLGIAFCLGMITFGLAMLIGNLAFVSPDLIRAVTRRGLAADTAVRTGKVVKDV